jgi:hypothetical protein
MPQQHVAGCLLPRLGLLLRMASHLSGAAGQAGIKVVQLGSRLRGVAWELLFECSSVRQEDLHSCPLPADSDCYILCILVGKHWADTCNHLGRHSKPELLHISTCMDLSIVCASTLHTCTRACSLSAAPAPAGSSIVEVKGTTAQSSPRGSHTGLLGCLADLWLTDVVRDLNVCKDF